MNAKLRILLVEDNLGDARLTTELLREAAVLDFELVHASNFADCLQKLAAEEFSVVLLDLSLSDATALNSPRRCIRVTAWCRSSCSPVSTIPRPR